MGILSIKLGRKSPLAGGFYTSPISEAERPPPPGERIGRRPEVIRYTIPGVPVSTNHGYSPARWGKRIGLRLNDRGEEFKARLLAAARAALMAAGHPDPLEQAQVAARIYFPTRGSDIDGPVKFLLDSLQASRVLLNDNRVRRLVLEKPDPDGDPRIELAVGNLGERCPHCGCCCGSVKP